LRSAADRGYRCITVRDACASGDPALHRAAMAMIEVEGGIFGEVATAAALIKKIGTDPTTVRLTSLNEARNAYLTGI
jgi:nicotinamidase-related amidase